MRTSPSRPSPADRDVVLADLVGLRVVGIEVVLAVEDRARRHLAVRAPCRSSARSGSPPRWAPAAPRDGRGRSGRCGRWARRRRRARSRRTSSSGSPAGRGSRARSPPRAQPLSRRRPPRAWRRSRSPSPARRRPRAASARRRRAPRSGSRPAARGPPPSGSASPAGIEIAGIPASGIGTVKKSFRYIASGSSVFSPSPKATDGEVGVTTKSTRGEGGGEVVGDLGPHLLRLPVVGVVVAGGERVGAEHDPPLDLVAEALRPGLLVHLDQVAVAPRRASRSGRRRSGRGSRRPRPGRSRSRRRCRARRAAARPRRPRRRAPRSAPASPRRPRARRRPSSALGQLFGHAEAQPAEVLAARGLAPRPRSRPRSSRRDRGPASRPAAAPRR